MYNSNYLKVFGLCGGIISSTLSFGLTLASPINLASSPEYLVSLEFPPAPNREPPKSTAAGAVRGAVRGEPCVIKGVKPLTALMPNRANQAKTVSSRPNFLFYIPPTKADLAQFTILDEQGKDVEVQEIQLGDTPGIIKVSLSPENALEIGQKYQWALTLICKRLKISVNAHVSGEIERVTLDARVQSTLETAQEPLAKAKIYANEQLWPETLMVAGDLRTSQPKEWEQLLQSVGLQDFSQEPFVNCCQAESSFEIEKSSTN